MHDGKVDLFDACALFPCGGGDVAHVDRDLRAPRRKRWALFREIMSVDLRRRTAAKSQRGEFRQVTFAGSREMGKAKAARSETM